MYQAIPRDGKIFDVQTADCLNTQIDKIDKIIDNYKVYNIPYEKRVSVSPCNNRIKELVDKSFYAEKLFCLRLSLPILKKDKNKFSGGWVHIADLPVDIEYDFRSEIFSENGYIYYVKILNKKEIFVTGQYSDTYESDRIVVNADLILSNNTLILD